MKYTKGLAELIIDDLGCSCYSSIWEIKSKKWLNKPLNSFKTSTLKWFINSMEYEILLQEANEDYYTKDRKKYLPKARKYYRAIKDILNNRQIKNEVKVIIEMPRERERIILLRLSLKNP